MLTRRWLSFLLALCVVVGTALAAQPLRIALDAGTSVVEYGDQEYVVETTAPIVVEFSSRGGTVTATVQLYDPNSGAAHVIITEADDPLNVIFQGVVRDAADLADLFFHNETGRGEQ